MSGPTIAGPTLTCIHTSLLAMRRATLHKKEQTPVYNPFDLEQSRLGLWWKEGMEHIQASLDGVLLFFWFYYNPPKSHPNVAHPDQILPRPRGEA